MARKNVISLQQILLITLLNYHRRSHSSLEEEVTNIFLLLKGSYFYVEKGPTELSPFNEGGELQIHYHFILLSVLQQEKKGKGKERPSQSIAIPGIAYSPPWRTLAK